MTSEVTTYAIQAIDGGPIKIGRTTENPESRLRGLQVASPKELVLIATFDGDQEQKLHEIFSKHHLRGEWYSPADELIGYILQHGNIIGFGPQSNNLAEYSISLPDVPKYLPKRNGKPVCHATVWRWAKHGVRGLKLKTMKFGGRRHTSLIAIKEFVAALTARDEAPAMTDSQFGRRVHKQKNKLFLQKEGFLPNPKARTTRNLKKPAKRVPSYCCHKAKDLAYVNFSGKMIYLGKYGSPESREKYNHLINEWKEAVA